MANYIQMPNGVYFPALEGEDYETTVRAAKEKYPEAYGLTKEAPAAPTGLVAAATRGTKAYLSQSQTALQGPSTESALAGIERGKELERQNPSQLGWDKVKAAYEQGLMPAVKEVARQVPLAIAEQIPNLAAMGAGAKAGSAAGAALGWRGRVAGGALGSLLGQGAASYLPQAGGNIEAQAQAQLERGEPVDVSGAKAYGAAVPQAAIDVVENKLLFGGRGVLARLLGTSDAVLAKKSAVELEKLAQEKIVPLLLKGTAKGVATEIPGEITQDILQRAQAGQELTSPEALRGYGETAFQVGLLGPLGAVGRLSERSGAKAELETKQLEDQQKAQQAGLQQQQQAAQQAQLDKLKPEYATKVIQKYQDLQAQAQQFQAAMNAKVEKDDFAGQQAKDDAKKAYAEFRKSDEFRQTLRDYMELKATSPAAVTPATPPAPPAQTPQMQAAVAAQKAFEEQPPAPPVEVQTTTPMPEPAELHATMQAFAKRLEDNQQAQSDAAAKADTEALKGLHAQYLDLTQQHAQAAQDLKDAGGYNAPKVPVEEIARLQKSIDRETTKLTAMAGPGFDPAVAAKAVARIERLKAELDPYQRQTLLEGKPNEAFMGAAREREAGTQADTAVQEKERRGAMFSEQGKTKPNEALLSAAREQITPEQAASVQREGKVGAETAALQRIGATEVLRPFPKEAPAAESEIPYVDELIATLPQGHTITPGAIRQGLGADKRNASDLRAQLAIATETKNREAKLEAINGLQALRDQNKERAARGTLGAEKTQAELGFGTMPEGRAKEAAANMHADKQNNILVQMVKTLDSLIRGRIPGTLTLNTGRIQQQFDAQKEAYVASQLAEINARRSAFGVPPMADWEAGNARARVMEALTELHERWGKADGVRPSDFTDRKEAVRAIQQHMRDNVYETVLTGAQRLQEVSKGEMAEKTGSTITHYTSRLDDKGKPIAIPPAKKGSRIAAPAELTLREAPRGAATDKQEAIDLVEHILSTVGRRTRAVPTEAVKAPTKVGSLADMKALFAAEKSGEASGKTDPATKHFLEQLAEILPKTNDADFIKMAREQAQQVMEGNLPSIHAVQALEEMTATHKGVSQIGEATQRQLFEGVDSRLAVERKDSWNFLNLLESESVQKVKEGIAKQRQANIDALNQARDVLITNKDTIAAEQKYQATLKKAQKQAAPLAEQIAVQHGQAELAKETLDPLRKSLADVQMQLDHVQAVKDRIAAGPTGKPVERTAPLSETDKDQLHKLVTQREYIALAEKALKRTTLTPEQRAVIEKQLEAARKAVEVTIAKPEVQKIFGMGTRPPSTRFDNLWTPEFLKSVPNVLAQETALKARKQELRVAIETAEKMGEEVQANIVALEKQLAATEGTATEDIAQAQEALGQAKEAKASKKRAAAVPETVSRVAEEEYQASVQNAREGMGLEGIRHEVDTADRETKQRVDAVRSELGSLNDQLANAAPEAKAEIQAKIDAAEAKLSSVFNLATRRVVQLKEEGQQDLEDAFTMRDTMTQAAKDARARRKSGEAAPALPQAREGPVVRPIGAGQGRVSESGTTKYRGKDESAIDILAEKRAELREIQRRMDFLRTNKKDKAGNRLTPVYKDLQAQEATAIAEVHMAEKAVRAEEKARKDVEAELGRKPRVGVSRKEEVREGMEEAKTGTEVTDTRSRWSAEDRSYAMGSEVESKALSSEQVDALEADDIQAALNSLAQDTSNSRLNRAVADRLAVLISSTSITLHDKLYDPKNPTQELLGSATSLDIELSRNGGLSQEVLLHEGVHSAVDRVLQMPEYLLTKTQRIAKRELQELYASVKNDPHFTSENAKSSLTEFVAEVMSNKNLQEQLQVKKWKMSDAWKGFKSIILRMLGIDWRPEDMLGASLQSVDALMIPTSRMLAKDRARSVYGVPAYRSNMPMRSAFIGKEAGKFDTFRGNFMGLAGRTQFVDRLAAADAGIVAAEGAGKLSSMEAFQTQYFMRMGDQVSQAAGQFITSGPMGIVKDNKTGEFRYESSKGANLKRMADYIEKAGVGEQEGERMLTALVAGERAEATPNGWNRLFASDPQAARSEYLADKSYLDAHPEAKKWMDAAKNEYKQYNDGLIDFAVQCGIISKDEGKRLQAKPYIPFYRVENGVVNLYMDSEHAFRIGDITNDPELKRMVGDSQHILPILTSAVQNTFMLTRMSMQNKTTMEVNNAMYKAGFVSKMGAGPGPASPDTVRYRVDGMPHFAVIDSDTFGIPAHLIVKGMEGIKTNLPMLVQAMGIPADWVRKFVTRSPAYAVRQLIRDPINAYILSGVDGAPVVGALKQLTKMQMGRSPTEESLMRGLAISSNVFSGNEKDMQKFLKDIVAGKSTWDKTLAKMDTLALQADAATRATIYEDSIAKGMSVAQAQFRALESQNFSRRGLSPTMHMLSTMIPFFNAQIQGLDVLYRSMTGKMPFSQKLDIQRKIMARGALLMTGSLAYALMMQDDDEYKKLSPEERYGNLLVPVPGFKNKLKAPLPYEAGILFMALPQAVVNAAMSDTKASEAALGIGKLLLNSAPGIIPVGPKPLLEAAYGSTTAGPIESRHEKQMQATSRYREDTPEALRLAGQATGMFGVSAVMLTHLVRGYTSTLGLSALHMLDPLLADKAAGEKATAEEAKLPFVGGLFQREGRFLIDRAYDRMDEVNQAKGTYDNLVERGQKAEAKAFAQRFASQLAAADTAGEMKQQMGELYKMERVIREHPKLSAARKDELLAKLKLAENKYAEKFVTLVDRTTHP